MYEEFLQYTTFSFYFTCDSSECVDSFSASEVFDYNVNSLANTFESRFVRIDAQDSITLISYILYVSPDFDAANVFGKKTK